MAEETLSNEERNNILKEIAKVPEKVEEKVAEKKSVNLAEDKSKPDSFGSLLEQTIAQREKMEEEDKVEEKHIDESREQAIKISRLDILNDFKL